MSRAARISWMPGVRRASAVATLGLLLALVGCGGGGSPGSSGGEEPTAGTPPAAPAAEVTQRTAVRLADQASFGASESLVAEIRRLGIEPWLAAQFSATGSRYTSGKGDEAHKNDDGKFCERQPDADLCWRDWFSTEPLLWDFYRNALTQPDQLRQRVAFALSQIVVISDVEVNGTYGWRRYQNMLLDNAFGNYREVLRKVTLSPMMGQYLDHVNNDKLRPNENFARELLQLFAIGTCELRPDGTLAGGRCQATYDNAIVRNYAFALTGWTFPAGGSVVGGCWPEGTNCTYLDGDMVAKAPLHDDQPRRLLGGRNLPAARTPQQALDAVLDSLLAHPNIGPFIGRQMIQHLVKSNPSPAYVQRVAKAFDSGRHAGLTRSFGSGTKGDLTATVAAVLLDPEARNAAPPLVAEKMREPVLVMTGLLRALNGRSDGEALGWWWGESLRQHMFRSPSVFNFYPPGFPVAGTTLVGPAFALLNPNTAFEVLNFSNQMIYWGGADPEPTVPGAIGTTVDLRPFEADAGDAAKLVDRLIALATGGRMSDFARSQIIDATQVWTEAETGSNWRSERVRTAAYLVFTSPAWLVLQ